MFFNSFFRFLQFQKNKLVWRSVICLGVIDFSPFLISEKLVSMEAPETNPAASPTSFISEKLVSMEVATSVCFTKFLAYFRKTS